MGVARYLTGIVCGVVAFAPLYAGIRAVSRRHFAYLMLPETALVDTVLFLSVMIVEAELLGSVGLFRLPAIVLVYAATGVALLWYAREAPASAAAPTTSTVSPTRPRASRGHELVAYIAVAVLAGQWAIRTVDSMRRGMSATADTIWYHMPIAARYVQTGWLWTPHYVDATSLTAFYPNASEIPHAIGIAFLRSDVLSPLLNLVWLALALVAGWSIGSRFGVAPLTMLGVAIVSAVPAMWLEDAGSAYNDVVGVALLLTALALLLQLEPTADARGWRAPLLFSAGLAAGIALGTKFTLLSAIGALTIGLGVVATRGTRARTIAWWTGGLAVGGAYFYLRNLVVVGNPLPPLKIGVGPLHLPQIPYELADTISHHLFERDAWHNYFLPGLQHALGPAWWAVLGLMLVGFVLGLVSARDRVVKVAAFTGAASFVAYIVSPQSLGFGSNLFFFEANVRYFATALALGATVLPIAAARYGRRATTAVLVVYVAVFVATQFDETIWRNAQPPVIANPTVGSMPRVLGVVVAVVLLLAGVALWARHGRLPLPRSRSVVLSVLAIVAVAVVAGGYVVTDVYQQHRYTAAPLPPRVSRWARDIRDARIAIVGTVLEYPFAGNDFSNRVDYVAKRGPNHHSSAFTDCAAWRRALNDGDYDYVVVASSNFPFPFPKNRAVTEDQWTRVDPAAKPVTSFMYGNGARITVFAVNGRLSPQSCPP